MFNGAYHGVFTCDRVGNAKKVIERGSCEPMEFTGRSKAHVRRLAAAAGWDVDGYHLCPECVQEQRQEAEDV
jgi:hypothetical protein